MKYPEARLTDCSERERLMLASAYLHYLFLRFQAQKEISQFSEAAEPIVSIARKILSVILSITTHSQEDGVIPRGFSWIVSKCAIPIAMELQQLTRKILFYGLPSAHVLVRELAQPVKRADDGKNRRLPRGETIRCLASFLAQLELIVSLKDGNSEAIQKGYQDLGQAFDRAIDGLEAPALNTNDIDLCEDTNMVSPVTWTHPSLDISHFLE